MNCFFVVVLIIVCCSSVYCLLFCLLFVGSVVFVFLMIMLRPQLSRLGEISCGQLKYDWVKYPAV